MVPKAVLEQKDSRSEDWESLLMVAEAGLEHADSGL